jgi:hypothetical protein
MVFGVRISPAPAARAYVALISKEDETSQQGSYQITLSILEALCSKVNSHQTPAASRVDGHARAMEVEGIRNPVSHDSDSISCSRVLWLPIRISKAYLLVV